MQGEGVSEGYWREVLEVPCGNLVAVSRTSLQKPRCLVMGTCDRDYTLTFWALPGAPELQCPETWLHFLPHGSALAAPDC